MAKLRKKLWTLSNYFEVELPDHLYFSSQEDGDKFAKHYLNTRRLEFKAFKREADSDYIEYTIPPHTGTARLYFRLTRGYIKPDDN